MTAPLNRPSTRTALVLTMAVACFMSTPLRGESVSFDFARIEAPISKVFRLLTDPREVSNLTKNTSNFVLPAEPAFGEGSSYKRIYYSHGIKNPQVVTFTQATPDRTLTLESDLVGWRITYRYLLIPDGDATLLLLKKEGAGGWGLFKDLMAHLLTRPEHDGDHLARVKARAEGKLP